MTGLSGQRKGPPGAGDAPVAAGDRFDSGAEDLYGSSHLEDILTRIHELLAEGEPGAEMATGGQADAPDIDPTPEAALTTGEIEQSPIFHQAADEAGRAFLEATRRYAEPEESGFVAQPPEDMVAPYSEVLKEVRDYFKDRHPLHPDDSLSKQFQDQPISSELRRAGEEAGPFSPSPEPLARETAAEAAPVTPPPRPRLTLRPVESDELPPRKAGPEKAPLMPQQKIPSPGAPARPGAELSQPVMVKSGELDRLQQVLTDRMGQLETVIGHHFGDRKDLAQDAARIAAEQVLKSLEETPVGRRLEALEKAFSQFQTRQDKANARTGEVLARLSDLFSRQESGGDLPPVGQPRDVEPFDAMRLAMAAPPAGHPIKPDGRPASPHEMNSAGMEQDGAVEAASALLAGEERPGVASSAVESSVEAAALRRDRPGEADKSRSPAGVVDEDLSEDIYSRQMRLEEASADPQGDPAEGGRQTMQFRQQTDQPPMADDYHAKSSDLRAQFNRSRIISKDDELVGMHRRGARPAIVIIAIALLLAAAGIAMRNSSHSLPVMLDNLMGEANRMFGKAVPKGDEKPVKSGDLKTDRDLILKRGEEEITITGNIERRDGGKMVDRLSNRGDEPGKLAEPEKLLPSSTASLTLPPALIGPYSLRHAAANGAPEAQYEVARRFSLGQGIDQDFEQAVRWFKYAAAQGFAPAQYQLGTHYERGRGVPRSFQKAQIWYKRAAERGNVKAMHNLAVLSTSLNKEKPDYASAVLWFREAASRNLADSQFNLAILFQSGLGVEQNQVEAYKWFSLAARQGDHDAASRRDEIEKALSKKQLLLAHNMLQGWKPLPMTIAANTVGLKGTHVTSTMSHAEETVTRSRVLTAQILLRRLGYDVAEADGALNEQTIAAIKKFEKDKGMPVTGQISSLLIKLLNKAAL